ncbi:MAG: DUF429 domain-containing protein [Thermoplasmata archaeon]|nr:MAG: DUF429 domain-containing protein [Thermoplasmata archaeon]
MMKILGIDLAGKTCNPTGICILQDDDIRLKTVYSDKEILILAEKLRPDIVAIDTPIVHGNPRLRMADKILRRYGALPPSFGGMKHLTLRGTRLAEQLKTKYWVIEVFPTATAKLLGIYDKDFRKMADILGIRVNNKHELDAYLCSLTARLFLQHQAYEVGDEEGKIVVPYKKNGL